MLAGSADELADRANFLPDFFWGGVSVLGIVVMDYVFGDVHPVAVQHKAARELHVVAAGQKGREYQVLVRSPRHIDSSRGGLWLTQSRRRLVPSTLSEALALLLW